MLFRSSIRRRKLPSARAVPKSLESRTCRFALPAAAAERVSDSEHDDFGDGDALDEQEGAIGAEDPQRAFDLAPPVKRQFAGDDFDELKICVRSRREEGRAPPPGRDASAEVYFQSFEVKSAEPQNLERPALGYCLSPSIRLDFW